MKKIFAVILFVTLLSSFVSCASQSSKTKDIEPQLSQLESICELATMKCYYHNVAKFYEKEAEGWWFWAKDKNFWIEYDAIITLGVDFSEVNMTVSGNDVAVTLPQAKILNYNVDSKSLEDSSSYITEGGSAEPKAEDQRKAFEESEKALLETVSADKTLFSEARNRVKNLIEEYIKNIGELVDVKYNIKWIDIDESEDLSPVSVVESEETNG